MVRWPPVVVSCHRSICRPSDYVDFLSVLVILARPCPFGGAKCPSDCVFEYVWKPAELSDDQIKEMLRLMDEDSPAHEALTLK